jgi:transcriptional regulator with XRE-family HTH domain
MEHDKGKDFGEYVKRRRMERRLTLRGLAAEAGIDSGALTRLEHGKVRQPKIETLKCLSEPLDVPFSDLCAMAGYVVAYDLPSVSPYLRARYGHLSEEKLRQAEEYLRTLVDEHHLDPRGPIGLEDEYTETDTH